MSPHAVMEYLCRQLFRWEVFSFGVGSLLVVAGLLVADEFRKFRAARILCYVIAAWTLGEALVWLIRISDNSHVRLLVSIFAFAFVGIVLVGAVRLINQREAKVMASEEETKKSDIEQKSEGANSPNIVGSGNTVIYNQNDPNARAKLDEIEALLKARQKRDDLLAAYPLGYVIFDVDYVSNAVTPYEAREGLERFQFDFRTVRITKNTSDRIEIQLPDLIKDSKVMAIGVKTGGWKRVGYLGGSGIGDDKGGMMELAEILAIKGSAITFLVGFQRMPSLPR